MKETILEIVARISSRVFLGPELCQNPAWLRITVDYTMNLFFGVMALKKWSRLLHPIVWRFVPEVRKVRQQIEEAVCLIEPVVGERIAGSRSSAAFLSKAKYTDAIQWAHELADGRPYHPALLQLGFSLAAIHTTTDHLSQALYDLCSYPEYIEPLRDELVTVLKESGMTKAGPFKLKLMDSFMKESQRLKPDVEHLYTQPREESCDQESREDAVHCVPCEPRCQADNYDLFRRAASNSNFNLNIALEASDPSLSLKVETPVVLVNLSKRFCIHSHAAVLIHPKLAS
jgi:cytochrome P450